MQTGTQTLLLGFKIQEGDSGEGSEQGRCRGAHSPGAVLATHPLQAGGLSQAAPRIALNKTRTAVSAGGDQHLHEPPTGYPRAVG